MTIRQVVYTAVCLLVIAGMRVTASASSQLDTYVRSIGPLSTPIPNPATIVEPGAPSLSGYQGFSQNWCGTDTVREQKNIGDVIAFNPNQNELYPGAVIQGKTFLDPDNGRFQPILEPKANLAVTVSKIILNAGPGLNTAPLLYATMRPAGAAEFERIQDQLVNRQEVVGQPGYVEFGTADLHNIDQASLELGFNASYLTSSLKGTISTQTSKASNTFIFKFVQTYYTMSLSSDPNSPSDVFGRRVQLDKNFQNQVALSNPAMYVSSVNYGRMLLLTITSNRSESDVKDSIQAQVSIGLGSGGGSLDATHKSILEDSYITALALGGSSDDITQIAANSITGKASDGLVNAIANWLTHGAKFDPKKSPAAPISYSVKYLADASPFLSAYSASYQQQSCNLRPVKIDAVRYTFYTFKDNSKRKQMYAYANLYDPSGRLVEGASRGGSGNEDWSEKVPYSFESTPSILFTYDECPNLKLVVGEAGVYPQNGDHSGLEATVKVEFEYAGQWHVVRDFADNDEFKWGDGSGNSGHLADNTTLSCPPASP